MTTDTLDRVGAAARVDCLHCRLPVPAGLVEPGSAEQFCCAGCRSVYRFLHDHELGRYYDLADAGSPATVSASDYAELDTPTFEQLYVRDRGDGLSEVELYLEGVHCTACVWLVEKLPQLVPGVASSRLDMGRNKATLLWRREQVALSGVARFVDSLGYQVHPFRGADIDRVRRREQRRLLIKIGVAGAVAGNVMLLAAALYSGQFGAMSSEHEQFFRWLSLLVTIPAVVYSGSVFFRGAFAALRARTLHLDLPISIGIAAGFAWGAANTIRGVGEIYFDTVAALIFLLLLGRWLQLRQQRHAADAAELLHSLTPSMARIVDGGGVVEVPIGRVLPGSIIEVRAGDTVPVDGTVVVGRSAVDSSLLTGESKPLSVSVGDAVHAGTLNVGARLRVAAQAAGEHTRIGRLMNSLHDGDGQRAPIVRSADRIAGWFVSAALGLAVLTFALWYSAGAGRAMEHAIALLIVTCPCALGLATPLAVNVAIGRAARVGMLIKGGAALESLARPGTMFLDKTGTVTRGQQVVVGWTGSASTLERVAALERQSAHPVARAIAAESGAAAASVGDVQEIPGAGIRGTVDGHIIVAGAPRYVEQLLSSLPATHAGAVDQAARDALTPVVVIEDGRVAGVISLGDPVRDDAAATIGTLRQAGWRVRLLSGDDPRVVRAVGLQLGLSAEECLGGVSPEGKRRAVQEAQSSGTVVMVGDGVNDTAAMTAATCGVAVSGSAEANLMIADVHIGRPGLTGVIALLRGARRTLATIHRNLAFSLLYNAAGVALAMTGVLEPLVAAVLMPFSSITVITSSYRSRSFATNREVAS